MDKQQKINKQMTKARKARKLQLANKGKDTYLNFKWMVQKYHCERMSLDTIGELCKVGYEVIWEALKVLKIPNRLIASENEIERFKEKVL